IGFVLELAVAVRGARVAIVNEGDIMSDEHRILDENSFANEGVTGDFAMVTDPRAFLDFDEGANLDFVSDFAPVKIGESIDANTFAEFHIGGDLLKRLRG